MTEECSKYYPALIILSSLLTVSLFTNIGLTVGVLRIKGKSSCMKGMTLLIIDYVCVLILGLGLSKFFFCALRRS